MRRRIHRAAFVRTVRVDCEARCFSKPRGPTGGSRDLVGRGWTKRCWGLFVGEECDGEVMLPWGCCRGAGLFPMVAESKYVHPHDLPVVVPAKRRRWQVGWSTITMQEGVQARQEITILHTQRLPGLR
jgi:hypothetical protein